MHLMIKNVYFCSKKMYKKIPLKNISTHKTIRYWGNHLKPQSTIYGDLLVNISINRN